MTDQPLSDILHETEKVDSPQDVLLGKVLAGRYKVESIIGHGGFGYVYSCLLYTSDAADE